ncbi:hypothetical protein ES702_03937 [subsurface metagenome]
MAYTEKAKELRRCEAIKPNGERCRAYALWGYPAQLCVVHAGLHHKGPMPNSYTIPRKARVIPCTCEAYAWPHRPGGGLCRWPDPPEYKYMRPAGSHRIARHIRRKWAQFRAFDRYALTLDDMNVEQLEKGMQDLTGIEKKAMREVFKDSTNEFSS